MRKPSASRWLLAFVVVGGCGFAVWILAFGGAPVRQQMGAVGGEAEFSPGVELTVDVVQPRCAGLQTERGAENAKRRVRPQSQRVSIAAPQPSAFLTKWLRDKQALEDPILDRLSAGAASAGEQIAFNKESKKMLDLLVRSVGIREAEAVLHAHPLHAVNEGLGELMHLDVAGQLQPIRR